MGLQINDDNLFTLSFADDQLIFAGDEDDFSYILRKLNEEYHKWGLKINFTETEYMVVGGKSKDLELEDGTTVKCCQNYLGAIVSRNGGSEEEMKPRMGKSRIATLQLYPIILQLM